MRSISVGSSWELRPCITALPKARLAGRIKNWEGRGLTSHPQHNQISSLSPSRERKKTSCTQPTCLDVDAQFFDQRLLLLSELRKVLWTRGRDVAGVVVHVDLALATELGHEVERFFGCLTAVSRLVLMQKQPELYVS